MRNQAQILDKTYYICKVYPYEESTEQYYTMKRLSLTLLGLLATVVLSAQDALESGTYYVQNVAAGTFLSSGATWGTRAVLSPHGVDIQVSVSDGAYTLITQIQGANKGLRPSDGYMDQSGTWTVEPLPDGTYALFNGSKYFGYAPDNAHPWVPRLDATSSEDKNTHWRFLSRADLTEGLSEATMAKPVDATFFIQAPDFLIGDYRVTGTKVWGPDLTAVGGNTSGSSYLRNNANAEKFNTASYNITQTLRGIPNGIYSLSVQGFYRNGSNSVAAAAHNNGAEELLPYLYAGSQRVSLPSVFRDAKPSATGGWTTSTNAGYVPNSQNDAANCFDDGESYVVTLRDIVVFDGTLTIGIAKDSKAVTNDWACFDNFTLLYYGLDLSAIQSAALEEIADYEALNTTADEDFATAVEEAKRAVGEATTEDEIVQALAALKRAYSIYYSKPEPEDTPIVLNALLRNADLSKGTEGWNATIVNNEGYNQTWATLTSGAVPVMEAYAGYTEHEMREYALTQPVTLAPGMYRLKGYAFYRYGTSHNSDLTNEEQKISCAYIVAGEHDKKVLRLGDVEQATYPNTLGEAATAFSKGQYQNSIIFELDDPTTLDIGYRGEHTRYRSWFVAGPVVLEKINDRILAQEAGDEFQLLKTQYALRWEGYKTISTQALDASAFETVLSDAQQSLELISAQEVLEAKDAEVWEALCTLLKTGTTATGQFDLTSLIVNPSLAKDLSGWTTTNSLVWNSAGLSEDFGHTEARFSQILERMPAGLYTMKVQAFYRMTTFGTSSRAYERGEDKVCAEMFLGTSTQPVKSINDDARYLSARPASDVAGAFGRSIPNTLNGVNDAFRAGQYWNVMRTEVPADGDLELGLRYADAAGESNWMPFDNFRLYYGAATVPVTLSEGVAHAVAEDTYANVTTDITLKAGQLNALCLPFDVPASTFESVWTLGGVEYDAEAATLTGTLVPAGDLKAGIGYFVRVAEDRTLAIDDVLLRATAPDSVPVLWEGAALQGYYGRSVLRRTYSIDDEGTLTYIAVKVNSPGYRVRVNLPTATNNKAKTIALNLIDYDNVRLTVDLENLQARAFVNNVSYPTATTASVIANYNRCPPGRRDQPHTVMVPVPANTASTLTLQYSLNPDLTEATTLAVGQGSNLCEVANLVPQQHYYYTLEGDGTVLSRGEIHTEGHLRMIKVPTVSNVRDLGGWKTLDGNRIRYGLVFRGGEMNAGHQMNETDRRELRRLGIGAEVDLREDKDIAGYGITTSALGSDAPYIYLNQNIWGDDALQQDTAKYHRIFDFILDNLRQQRAIYFHCIWGADRTGATAFLLEGLLGLTPDQMYKDYELTSFSIAGERVKTGLDSKFTYIRTLAGKTLQDKFFTYWNSQVGVSADDLCEFILRMTDGEPAITGIQDVVAPQAAGPGTDVEYYTPDGRRQSQPARGINIVRQPDGSVRKVLIK